MRPPNARTNALASQQQPVQRIPNQQPRELPADSIARMRALYAQPGTSFTSENYREPMAQVNLNPDSRPRR